MNSKLILWSVTVSLGGLLFGLDTAVISGAEQDIQQLWHLSTWSHGLAIAMALYGTVIGAAFGGFPADKFGRKKTLLGIGLFFFVSSLGAALATDVFTFMGFRFIGGLSIGASSVVAPIYISEIAPPQYRGRMGISFQLNIVLGILIAFISNYLLAGSANDWRWMLGVVAIPSLLFSVLMVFTPESPRWLILFKQDETTAKKILSLTNTSTEDAIAEIKNSGEEGNGVKENIFSKRFRLPVLLAFLIAFFNQLSGINAVIYYAPRIFQMAGSGKEAALFSTVGIGIANLIFTIIGWALIDRLGRKVLMYIGSFGYLITLSLIAWSFYTKSFTYMPLYIFAFIGAHAVGQGAVIWVFISEIFPNTVRASGMALGCLTHWVFAAIIANIFPFFAGSFGGGPIFAFFTVMMFFQLLYVWKLMPETKGISLEDLQKKLLK